MLFVHFHSNLDLSPFIAKETRNKIDYLPTYDLCGVITHRGTMRMGHYTCMVRLLNQSDQDEVGRYTKLKKAVKFLFHFLTHGNSTLSLS